MAYWLFKTEPTDYAWADLVRDGQTDWDGVANATALKHLRAAARGDGVLIYHTGTERAVVGVAEIVRPAGTGDKAQPNDSTSPAAVRLKAVGALPRPIPLATIKADPVFAGFDLIRIGRLSVVPVPATMWRRICSLGGL